MRFVFNNNTRLVGFLLLAACGTAGPSDPPDTDEDTGNGTDTDDGSACSDLQGEGFGEGSVSMNWTLEDVNGDEVSLYDYCGQVVYIEDTTAW